MAGHDDGDPLHPLTPREREVLELLRLGLTNGEIAGRLEITLDGAKYHVSEIIGKLGVRDRHEAASYPERRSGWATALAPIAFLWRQAGALVSVKASSVALVASAGLGAAALGGIGLIVFFLMQDGGGAVEEVSRQAAIASAEGIVSAVENPGAGDAESGALVPADLLATQQRALLDGTDAAPGLREMAASLARGDLERGCEVGVGVLRYHLLNQVLITDGSDSVRFSDSEISEHDPADLFIGDTEAAVRWFPSQGFRTPPLDELEGGVVSAVWRDEALALVDLLYALGPACTETAKSE